jgi:hypothetical protein
VKRPFAHDATLAMGAGQDERAPGGAITTALCGHWEHDPPCPLAPHHIATHRDGDHVRLRILFAAEEADEPEARRRIEGALAGSSGWRLLSSAPSEVLTGERDHARRLMIS